MHEHRHCGGCLCGAIRYEARGEPSPVCHCHCSLCRRASGAPFVTWATFPTSHFRVVQGQPLHYPSSRQAVRGFCGRCGTQLTFQYIDDPLSIDLTLGSFDHPETIAPMEHIWVANMLPWVDLADDLPRHAGSGDNADSTEYDPAL